MNPDALLNKTLGSRLQKTACRPPADRSKECYHRRHFFSLKTGS